MQRLFYLFLPALVFLASCDEVSGGDPVVDEGLPTIVDFSAAPAEVSAGGSATLSWNVSDATSITIDNGVGDVTSDADNQVTVDNVQQTTTYILTATNAQGSTQEQTRVTVTGDTPPPPPPGQDAAAPTGSFGVSETQNGPFQNDEADNITSPDDERIVTVAPGETFYAQVDYSDPSGITDIAINLVSSNPPGIAGELDPAQQFFTLGDPVGACDLSSTQTSVTCVYPINVADDAVNITELDNSGNEFAYVFRTLVTDGAGNQSQELIRGYVIVDGEGQPPTNPNPPANGAPNADFTFQQQEGTLQVQFNASSSSDADGQIAAYSWNFGDGSDEVTPPNAVFTKTYGEAGSYEVTLTVTDDDGATGTETKTVTVEAVDAEPEAPSITSFTATPNPAAVNDNVELTWEIDGEVDTLVVTDLESGASRSFPQDGAAIPSSTEIVAQTTRDFQLTVANEAGEATETLTLTVEQPSNPNPPPANGAPNADAGEDQEVGVGEEVALDGSGSSDPDGDTLSYAWEFTSQPEGSSATLADTESPTFTPSQAGEYVAQLTVTDGNGGSDTDSVTITAQSEGQPPSNPDPAAPVINSFTATPNPASVDDEVTLTWEITGEVTTLTVTDLETNQSRNFPEGDAAIPSETTITAQTTRDFQLTVANEAGEATETLTLTVEASSGDNGGLEANDDTVDLSLSEDEQAVIDVIENDDYPDDNFPNIVVTEQPDNGTAGQNAELISYTPEADFTGTDTFEYTLTIRDRAAGTAFSDTAMVTVNVQQ